MVFALYSNADPLTRLLLQFLQRFVELAGEPVESVVYSRTTFLSRENVIGLTTRCSSARNFRRTLSTRSAKNFI